jgi:hypothetical protein
MIEETFTWTEEGPTYMSKSSLFVPIVVIGLVIEIHSRLSGAEGVPEGVLKRGEEHHGLPAVLLLLHSLPSKLLGINAGQVLSSADLCQKSGCPWACVTCTALTTSWASRLSSKVGKGRCRGRRSGSQLDLLDEDRRPLEGLVLLFSYTFLINTAKHIVADAFQPALLVQQTSPN